MITYNLPQWMTIMFLIAIPIPFILNPLLARQGAPLAKKNAVFFTVLIVLMAYFAYITIACKNGLFAAASFPPKVLLFTTFPYALLLFGVVGNLPIFKEILSNIALPSLVRVHIFRLIGVFFILLALYDTLPKWFAFIAGFGDMITAITSLYVAKQLENKANSAKKVAFIWNTFGTIDILFTAIMANVLTKISMNTGAQGVDVLAQFPFCIIPAFAPPTILFLHYAIYKKMGNGLK